MSQPAESVEPLRQRWHQLLAPFAPPADAVEPVWRLLADAYSGPERHYHDLTHVRHVLDVLEAFRTPEHHAAALDLAAWFHDAVYDPRAADNEERSAALAADCLGRLGVPAEVRQEVGRLILLTKTHQTGLGDPDGQFLLDADLAILGAAPEVYRRYAAAVRREYAWVPDADFRAGRARVLQLFLRRDHIYQTVPLRAALEAAARRNLEQELADLTAR
jgi:predicted metal-dependent HD superfamily phosphohydrolase